MILKIFYVVHFSSGRLTQITGSGGHIMRLHQTDDKETVLETATGLQTILNFNQFDGALSKIVFPSGGELCILQILHFSCIVIFFLISRLLFILLYDISEKLSIILFQKLPSSHTFLNIFFVVAKHLIEIGVLNMTNSGMQRHC